MSKLGMSTFVKVSFNVRSPRNPFVNDLKYLPSYFGPVTELKILAMGARKLFRL